MGCGKPLRGRLRLPATGTTAGCTARAARVSCPFSIPDTDGDIDATRFAPFR